MKTNLISISFKNLFRHKVKTILTVTAIAVGIGLYIWMDGFLYGADIDSRRNLVNYETGAAKIYSKAYFENKDELPTYESFGNYEKILEKLEKTGYYGTPRAVFTGSILSIDNELPFKLIGIDPEQEKKIFRYHLFLDTEDSKFVENGEFKILIGVRGAKNLNVKVGDKVRLSTTIDIKDENGKIRHVNQLLDLSIGGIINSPNPKTNGNIAYLPLDILQDENGILLNGKITEICIRKQIEKDFIDPSLPGKFENPELITSKLGNTLDDNLILVSWKEDAKDFLTITRTKSVGNKIIIVVLFLLAVIGIANTMLMAIFERTKEIGMLRALGMTNFQIFRLFISEAWLIGVIGTLIGATIGIIATYFMVEYGIDYTKMMEQMNTDDFGYRIVSVFRAAWNLPAIIGCIILGPIISAITAMLPAFKAVKLKIVDCLRFE